MARGEVPASEAEWAAQDDARTLARAEEIKADHQRLQAAKTQAVKLLEKEQDELASLRKVAGRSPGKQSIAADVNAPNPRSQPGSSSPSEVFGSFKRII